MLGWFDLIFLTELPNSYREDPLFIFLQYYGLKGISLIDWKGWPLKGSKNQVKVPRSHRVKYRGMKMRANDRPRVSETEQPRPGFAPWWYSRPNSDLDQTEVRTEYRVFPWMKFPGLAPCIKCFLRVMVRFMEVNYLSFKRVGMIKFSL